MAERVRDLICLEREMVFRESGMSFIWEEMSRFKELMCLALRKSLRKMRLVVLGGEGNSVKMRDRCLR